MTNNLRTSKIFLIIVFWSFVQGTITAHDFRIFLMWILAFELVNATLKAVVSVFGDARKNAGARRGSTPSNLTDNG